MFDHAKIVQALRNDKKKVIFFALCSTCTIFSYKWFTIT